MGLMSLTRAAFASRQQVGAFVVLTTWRCGRETRSRRMRLEMATRHAAGMRRVCTVAEARIEPVTKET